MLSVWTILTFCCKNVWYIPTRTDKKQLTNLAGTFHALPEGEIQASKGQ